jgi:carbon monoxide dehydrogenase subunit G
MDLTHRFTVPAPIDEVWAAFNDLERIAPCFPGAALTSFDGEKFEGLVKVKLGPISLQYTGTGRFVERDEAAKRAVIEAKGKDKRGNGTAAANITAQLMASGDNETDVEVVTDLNVTGRPAQFGRGVMQDVSDKLLAQFATCLETRLGSNASTAGDASPVDETAAAPTPTSAAALAAGDSADAVDDRTPIAEQAEKAVKSGQVTAGAVPPATAPPLPHAEASTPRQENAAAATSRPKVASASSPDVAPSSRPKVASTPGAELDLGATVLPVLVKRYAGQLVGVVVAWWILRKVARALPRRR